MKNEGFTVKSYLTKVKFCQIMTLTLTILTLHDVPTIHLTKSQKNSRRGCWDITKVKLPNLGQVLPNYDRDLENVDVEWCPMTPQYIWHFTSALGHFSVHVMIQHPILKFKKNSRRGFGDITKVKFCQIMILTLNDVPCPNNTSDKVSEKIQQGLPRCYAK